MLSFLAEPRFRAGVVPHSSEAMKVNAADAAGVSGAALASVWPLESASPAPQTSRCQCDRRIREQKDCRVGRK